MYPMLSAIITPREKNTLSFYMVNGCVVSSTKTYKLFCPHIPNRMYTTNKKKPTYLEPYLLLRQFICHPVIYVIYLQAHSTYTRTFRNI